MAKPRSLAAALHAAQIRPGNRPSMQRTVREGTIATLRRALQNRLIPRWTHDLGPLGRGPSMLESAPTTLVGM